MQKTILCYGDSNTWGFVPGSANYETMYMERYARNERWPGLLQQHLGDQFYVIEEGLNGRTINRDYQYFPDRNGKTYLPPCLYSHAPIDLVVLGLGGNDLKTYFNLSVDEITNGLAELVEIIQSSKYGANMSVAPKILILSYPIPLPIIEEFKDENGVLVFDGGIKKAQSLVGEFEALAKAKQCEFLNISRDIQPSKIDGMHLDQQGHAIMADLLHEKIRDIYA